MEVIAVPAGAQGHKVVVDGPEAMLRNTLGGLLACLAKVPLALGRRGQRVVDRSGLLPLAKLPGQAITCR